MCAPRTARLKRLAWLIGEWVDESDESTMHTTTRWSEDGNFLITDFTIRVAGPQGDERDAAGRLGWIARQVQVRGSLIPRGGHAEGIWNRNRRPLGGEGPTGVRPDGDACSATHTYEQTRPDVYVFSVIDRIIGDEDSARFHGDGRSQNRLKPEKATAAVPHVARQVRHTKSTI